MSMVSLEALCVFVDAMDTTGTVMTLRDIVTILEHLDGAGWEIARKPQARAVTINDPVPAPDDPSRWPPIGIAKLWATDMEPHREVVVLVNSAAVLRQFSERGATFVEAPTKGLAVTVFLDRHKLPSGAFTIGEDRFPYYSDDIPF